MRLEWCGTIRKRREEKSTIGKATVQYNGMVLVATVRTERPIKLLNINHRYNRVLYCSVFRKHFNVLLNIKE